VDVRLIAATNHDLEKAIAQGEFRQDLYYRLNVFPLNIPPLRERKDDIPLLVNYFINKYSTRLGKKIKSIPLKVMTSLENYPWPGNIRELENVIERAVIMSDNATLALEEMFSSTPINLDKDKQLPTLKESERTLILRALTESNWVIEGNSGAAIRLGVIPGTLRHRMKMHGIKRPPD
jgi:chemotaxis protein methyltransferase CheR